MLSFSTFLPAQAASASKLSAGMQRALCSWMSREILLNVVKQNIEQTGFEERSQTMLSKAESFLKKPSGPYDIVFLDPPYAIGITALARTDRRGRDFET